MAIGIALLDLYSFLHRRELHFQYVFSVDGVPFYVAADDRTRRQFGDADAYTLGTSVFARTRRALTWATIRHELKHVEQARQHGALWPFRYSAETARRGYHNNKYERAARRAEKKSVSLKRVCAAAPWPQDSWLLRLREFLADAFR